MSIEVTIDLQRLAGFIASVGANSEEATRLAVNGTASFGRRTGSKQIRSEINFSADYLGSDENQGRLAITKRASQGDPQAVVTGVDRPTSLARFATTAPSFGRQAKRGVTVRVGRGSHTMPNAFFMRLRAGASADEAGYNVGVAIRLKPGQRPANKHSVVDAGKGLYLLYGPSVGQAFGVLLERDDLADQSLTYLEAEYIRQFVRLNDGQ